MAADEWIHPDVDGVEPIPTAIVDRGASLATAFEAYRAELFSFLRRSTRDDDTAEDLLQDAFLRLARELDAGRRPDNVRAWLYRVASNLAVSRARRGATVLAWMARHGRSQALGAIDESPESGVLRSERRLQVDAALGKLSREARTALLLSAQGFSGTEIAEAIGRTHGATRTLMSRARVTLRLDLEELEDRS